MQLIRVKEASGRYQISRHTFYKWNALKRFPGLFARVGKVLFVDESELRRIARSSKRDG